MPPICNFNDVVQGFAARSRKGEGIFAWIADREFHQAGLGRRHDHRHFRGRRIGPKILQQRENQAIGQICRQLHTLARRFFFAVVIGVVDRNLSGGGRDRDFGCVRKRRALLHEVIADEPEVAALRKNGSFFCARTILEAEYQAAGDPIAMGNLGEIAFRDLSARRAC